VLDPLIGAAGDTSRRRAVLVLGGVVFAVAGLLVAAAQSFGILLAALLIANPASGAFVSLAQATLMDIEPSRRERNMARWTLAGSFGYVGGPLLLAVALGIGFGWRPAIAALAVLALPLAAAARRTPHIGSSRSHPSFSESLRSAFAALRRPDVLTWLATLEAADLMLDVFHGFLALYLVDIARFDPKAAAIGVAVWTGAGLVGDWLLLAILKRMDGLRYLRLSALASLVVYPAFLVASSPGAKLALVAVLGLLNSGWYAIPKARLYEALPGQSGAAVAVGGIGGLVGAAVPLVLGAAAASFGLGPTMWLLLVAPLALYAAARR
jgi:FSR family fosmidomycin resistance protein-like MFS transporter